MITLYWVDIDPTMTEPVIKSKQCKETTKLYIPETGYIKGHRHIIKQYAKLYKMFISEKDAIEDRIRTLESQNHAIEYRMTVNAREVEFWKNKIEKTAS